MEGYKWYVCDPAYEIKFPGTPVAVMDEISEDLVLPLLMVGEVVHAVRDDGFKFKLNATISAK